MRWGRLTTPGGNGAGDLRPDSVKDELSRRELRRKRAAGRLPVPFIVGVNRSGTTLLRMMLDAHPELAIPPETHFVPDLIELAHTPGVSPDALTELVTAHRRWGDFGLGAEQLRERFATLDELRPRLVVSAFFELYAEGQGKSRWGDKTPNYIKQIYAIQKVLPEARFIHVIRDGHDVALSIEERNPGESSMQRLAERWVRRIEWARRQRDQVDHYLEVRYEQLVLDPESVLRDVCGTIEIGYEPAMLEYYRRAPARLRELARDLPAEGGRPGRAADERLAGHAMTASPPDRSRIGRWHHEMAEQDCADFEAVAGALLRELGYETREGR